MGMDRNVDPALKEGFFDLLGEEALAFDLIKTEVLDAIAFGLDDDDLRGDADLLQLVLEIVRLPKRKVASTTSDPDLIVQ